MLLFNESKNHLHQSPGQRLQQAQNGRPWNQQGVLRIKGLADGERSTAVSMDHQIIMDPPHQNIRESRWNHRCKISESGRAWHAGKCQNLHTLNHHTEVKCRNKARTNGTMYCTLQIVLNIGFHLVANEADWYPQTLAHPNTLRVKCQVSTSLSSKSFRFTCLLNSQASLTSSMWWWWHCRFVRTCQQSFKALFHKVLELSVSKSQSWRGWCIINNRIPFISHHGICDHPPETSIWWNFPSQHWPFSSLQNLGGA